MNFSWGREFGGVAWCVGEVGGAPCCVAAGFCSRFPFWSLPPFRGEVRWGVRRSEPMPPIVRAPISHAAPRPPHRASPHPSFLRPPIVIPAPPLPSFLRRQEWWGRGLGCWRAVGERALPPTPHLASPLKGGRDEFFLGEFAWCVLLGALGWVGSCLRRNDSGRAEGSCVRLRRRWGFAG